MEYSQRLRKYIVIRGVIPGLCPLKGHCDTRWSSKADAVKAISTQLDEVIAALEKLRDTPTETITDTREDAAVSYTHLN